VRLVLARSVVPFSSVVGDQYRDVLLMGPLWLMRAGRRFGVHFFVSVDCIESMVVVYVCAVYAMRTWLALVEVVWGFVEGRFWKSQASCELFLRHCRIELVLGCVYVALENGFRNVRVHALVDASKRVAAEQARLVLPNRSLCKYDDAIVHGLPQRLLNLCFFMTHLLT
jgi:hypothetical protein